MTVTLVSFCAERHPLVLADIRFDDRADMGVPHRETAARVSRCRQGVFSHLAKECQERAIVLSMLCPAAVFVGFVCIGVENDICLGFSCALR